MATPTCESCGAGIEPSHLTCPFCSAVTPFGLRRREEDEVARRAREAQTAAVADWNNAQARGLANAELDRLGRLSLSWSIAGFVFCCAPVPSVVALVLAYRARAVARENKYVLPAQATIGFLLSVLTMVLSVAFYSFAGVTAVQKQRRISALQAATTVKAAEETLDHDTACALIELHLLQHGFTSSSDAIDKLTCDGAVEQRGAAATVKDVTFEAGSTFHTAEAALKRETRWVVEGLKERGERGGGEGPVAPASATGAPAPLKGTGAPAAGHGVAPAPTHHGEPGGKEEPKGTGQKGAPAPGHSGGR